MPETITALPGATDELCGLCHHLREYGTVGPGPAWCDLFNTVIEDGKRFRLCMEGEKELERLRRER